MYLDSFRPFVVAVVAEVPARKQLGAAERSRLDSPEEVVRSRCLGSDTLVEGTWVVAHRLGSLPEPAGSPVAHNHLVTFDPDTTCRVEVMSTKRLPNDVVMAFHR